MTAGRLVSLASGVHPDLPPDAMARVAGEAGYDSVGLWVEPGGNWHAGTTREVTRQIDDYGLVIVDVEVIWLKEGADFTDFERLIEIGGALGARNALIVSSLPDPIETRRQFAKLCELGAAAGVRTCLEFMGITAVKTLDDAVAVLRDVDHPNAGLLLDSFHLDRTGSHPDDTAGLPREWFPYLQLCDAPERRVIEGFEAYLEDALDGRSAPGEGTLPCRELLDAFAPDVPLSLEIRSKAYRDDYPDPVERARVIRERTEAFLADA